MATIKSLLDSTFKAFLESKKAWVSEQGRCSDDTIYILPYPGTSGQIDINYTPPADGWVTFDDNGSSSSMFVQGQMLSYFGKTGTCRASVIAPVRRGGCATLSAWLRKMLTSSSGLCTDNPSNEYGGVLWRPPLSSYLKRLEGQAPEMRFRHRLERLQLLSSTVLTRTHTQLRQMVTLSVACTMAVLSNCEQRFYRALIRAAQSILRIALFLSGKEKHFIGTPRGTSPTQRKISLSLSQVKSELVFNGGACYGLR